MKQNELPLCSICCLSYNHEKFIKQNIEQIWKQEYKNIEIITLDDGSSDNSVQVLNDLQKISPIPMKVISQKNSGKISKNFNTLIENANGKYILLMSCDDKITDNIISPRISLMENNENMVFVASKNLYKINNLDEAIGEDCQEHLKQNIKTAGDLLNCEYENIHSFFIQGALFRKDIINRVSGFDEDLLGDDIVLRIKIYQYMQKHPELTFKINDEYGFYYRMHNSNIHKNSIRQIKLVSEVLERYFPDREPPKLFYGWLTYTVKNNSFKSILAMFRESRYLQSIIFKKGGFRILNSLFIKPFVNYFANTFSFIYKKNNINKTDREIVILSIFKIRYKKQGKIYDD